jgi:hypothetical protein
MHVFAGGPVFVVGRTRGLWHLDRPAKRPRSSSIRGPGRGRTSTLVSCQPAGWDPLARCGRHVSLKDDGEWLRRAFVSAPVLLCVGCPSY